MSLFNISAEDKIEDNSRDSVGGGNAPAPSGVYDAIIELAYMDMSKGGAKSVNLVFKAIVDGQERRFRQTEFVTSGKAKGQKPYYTKDGKNIYLPGFQTISGLCQVTLGRGLETLGEDDVEEKNIKLYDFNEKKETMQEKDVIVSLLKLPVKLGVLSVIDNKRAKNDEGDYVPTHERRTSNEIDKHFNEDGLTSLEIKAGKDEPEFLDRWIEKYDGKPVDRFDASIKDPNAGAATTSGTEGGGSSAQAAGLFND